MQLSLREGWGIKVEFCCLVISTFRVLHFLWALLHFCTLSLNCFSQHCWDLKGNELWEEKTLSNFYFTLEATQKSFLRSVSKQVLDSLVFPRGKRCHCRNWTNTGILLLKPTRKSIDNVNKIKSDSVSPPGLGSALRACSGAALSSGGM